MFGQYESVIYDKAVVAFSRWPSTNHLSDQSGGPQPSVECKPIYKLKTIDWKGHACFSQQLFSRAGWYSIYETTFCLCCVQSQINHCYEKRLYKHVKSMACKESLWILINLQKVCTIELSKNWDAMKFRLPSSKLKSWTWSSGLVGYLVIQTRRQLDIY